MNTHTSHRSLSLRAAFALAAASVALPAARAEFTEAFAPSNWTLLNAGGSSITFTDTFTLTIVGPNDGSGINTAEARITIPEDGTLSFSFSGVTADKFGWGYDPLSYRHNGTRTRFSPTGTNTDPISGVREIAVQKNDVFGFIAWSQDSRSGASTLTITDFTFTPAAVPEPSAFAALAGLATLGLAATRRRRAV